MLFRVLIGSHSVTFGARLRSVTYYFGRRLVVIKGICGEEVTGCQTSARTLEQSAGKLNAPFQPYLIVFPAWIHPIVDVSKPLQTTKQARESTNNPISKLTTVKNVSSVNIYR